MVLKNMSSPLAAVDTHGEGESGGELEAALPLWVACQEGDKARQLPKDPRTTKRTETSDWHNQNTAS